MNKYLKCFLMVFPLLVLGSCRSTKTLQPTTSVETKKFDAEAYKKRVASFKPSSDFLTAKLNLTLQAGAKPVSVGGSLKIKHNDVIQISLTFLGLEVGRMEFTPNEVLILDRFNKQYVKTTYDKVGALKEANINFYTLQALFTNNLFCPGSTQINNELSRFKVTENQNQVLISLSDAPQLNYDFTTRLVDARILKTNICGKEVRDKTELEWAYDNFVPFGNQMMPSRMKMTLKGLKKNYSIDMSLSRMDTKSDWDTRTAVPQKYKQRSVNDIMHKILSM